MTDHQHAPTCIGCGGPCVRSKGESAPKFRRRRYCSRACMQATAPPLRRTLVAAPRLVKPCERAAAGCTVKVVQRPEQSRATWEARKYCSPACATAASRAAPEAKACELCGQQFHRPEGRPPVEWVRRKFCSKQCAGAARTAEVRQRGSVPAASAPTRPKGNTKPRESRFAPAMGAAERAASVLRRVAPVWPESIERPGSAMWVVGGLRLTAEQMIERAQRMRAA